MHLYFSTGPKWPPHCKKPSLPTLQYQKKSEIFCAAAVCWKNMKKESFNVLAFSHFIPSLQDAMTNFLWSTWSIDFLLSTVNTSSITTITHIVWCCSLFYGLTFHAPSIPSMHAHYRVNHPSLLELATVQSISACPRSAFHSRSTTLWWVSLPKRFADGGLL